MDGFMIQMDDLVTPPRSTRIYPISTAANNYKCMQRILRTKIRYPAEDRMGSTAGCNTD